MDNLFSAEWTVGDLSTIGFIKKWLGVVAVLFISIIGFGIVIATIIRNAGIEQMMSSVVHLIQRMRAEIT